MRPAIPPLSSSAPSIGAFASCLSSKKSTVKCSICHLPVRSLLFQRSVCQHGGHQSCYRRYYLHGNCHARAPHVLLPGLLGLVHGRQGPVTLSDCRRPFGGVCGDVRCEHTQQCVGDVGAESSADGKQSWTWWGAEDDGTSVCVGVWALLLGCEHDFSCAGGV
ncbi:hypothetical protein DFP72DRAFT_929763 [Ephemerocybe angulata]|uniref:WDR59/RTC1-like RING zinc finger domain-containing protein n=1 Tax=Ephemerocybe angulata TaxID=980116 RepID=A0A8H6HC39_9AGAR|nr:hypothetical protein DFP72DRAFT_929763 [Tulosesus angulatus]